MVARSYMKLREAKKAANELRRRLRLGGRRAGRFRIVGSIRRGAESVRDLDLLLVHENAGEADSPLLLERTLAPRKQGDRLTLVSVKSAGASRLSLRLRVRGRKKLLKADVFAAKPKDLPYAMLHHTGPKSFNIALRAHSKRRGWKLNQYGLFYSKSGRRVRGSRQLKTEKQVVKFIGKTYSPPHARE